MSNNPKIDQTFHDATRAYKLKPTKANQKKLDKARELFLSPPRPKKKK